MVDMMQAFNEGESRGVVKEWVDELGLDFKKEPLEIDPFYGDTLVGGILTDEKGEASLRGLYAAGTVMAGAVGSALGALTFGYHVGSNASIHASDRDWVKVDSEQVEDECNRIRKIRNKVEGIKPKKFEEFTRMITGQYVGMFRSGDMMRRGLVHLERLRRDLSPHLFASDSHELMRAIEALNILDLAEIHIKSALMRTESRLGAYHHRLDYPEKNDPEWYGKVLVAEKKGKGIMVSKREISTSNRGI
jgi:succinate dehydrogenase/fumarate reductase flavoprotein subunit